MEYTEQQLKIRRILGQSATKKRVVSAFDVDAQQYSIHQWELETFDINNSKAIVHINEDYMLSKAFSGAMQPTRVIPFYFRASFMDEDEDEDNDYREGDDDGPSGSQHAKTSPFAELPRVKVDPSLVTITTLITPDRYGVFLKLVKQYRGPISVATHIKKGEDQDRLFHELNAFFQKHAILRKYVDLHVIVDGVDLQLNMWRNIARMFARTDYFMMLDVDFHIPSSLKNNLHRDPRIRELLSSGAALVIPAFEYSLEHDPKDSRYFPDTKADLIPLLEKNHIRVFHDSFPPGHAATDTARWIKMSKRSSETEEHRWGSISPPRGRAGFDGDYDMSNRIQEDEDEDDDARFLAEGVGPITEEEKEAYLELEASGERPYKITAFEPKYEPYIVLKREGTHWCDERFVGYGANKAACLFEIYISGIDFWVMPQDFLIHQYHDYPTTNRKNGRILNKQLFVHFQQEICYGTLQRMIETGEWYTTKADNLRHQCSAFDNFLKSADELAQEYESQHPGSLLEEAVFVADLSGRKTEERSRLAHSLNKPNQSQDQDENERLNDDRSGDRYDSRGHGKAALGEQIVDDEEHQDPFMSRPKGKVWGGIQPKTYYVPPPPMDEDGIPIDGIDIDAMLEGSFNVGADQSQVRHDVAAEEGGSWHKQDGSVLEEGVGSKDMGHEGGQTSQWLDKDAYRFQAGGSEHSTDSFEDAAEKLEGTFRVIGAST
ncbi:hypothetical protein BGZ98_008455 [Dissophora globulifera]|nr:hypothetical protein BGZ98_008455 [Dissophora globulifera]